MLNYDANEHFSYDRIREMVINALRFDRDHNTEAFSNDRNFRITKKGEIFTVPMIKQLKPTYFKGVLRNRQIVPFGYIPRNFNQ